uniref:Uncharacterized protein n=1 Tax=Ralstonia solanacearum TaxID=305 RepID=A0A0S4WHB1_RALSL|nr:protein of unknown function [Ralstonia solanacearum]
MVQMLDFGQHLGVDQSGRDAVDGNASRGQLHGQRLRRADQARFRGAVVDLPTVAHHAGDGCDRHDAPALAQPDHRHGQRMHDVVEAVQARFEHDVPVLLGQRGKRGIARHTRAQDDAVVGAVFRDIGLEQGTAGHPVPHVKLHHACGTPLGLDGRYNGFGIAAPAAAMHGDLEAVGCQSVGYGATDAPAGTCHENAAAHDAKLPSIKAWKSVGW